MEQRYSGPELDRNFGAPNPKKVLSIFEQRLRQFTDGGEYKDLYLAGYYDRKRISDGDTVHLAVYSVPDLKRPLFKKAIKEAVWKNAYKGQSFGPSWATHWFRIDVRIPPEWKDADEVLWEWNSNDEGFLYSEDGYPITGLSGEHNRKEWTVPVDWRDGKWHRFYIETACNNIQGDGSPPNPNRYFQLSTADLVWPHHEARALYIDFWLLSDAAREMPGDSWQKHKAREVGNKIMDVFDPKNLDDSIAECRKIAATYIGDLVDSDKVYASKQRREVIAVGNCHIDTAWLWPYAETRRKIGRSWASQCRLLEKYPEYYFAASQQQQFQWLLEDYPQVFDDVKKAIEGGRFIPIGGTWVECDTNLPSGESLTRQFLLGQRFLQSHFGMRTKTFWLPDTFGYSPQLPQLCRLAGCDRFLTQKLSWNNINVFPNSTFRWVALDGSQVVCHMPPDNTYTAAAHFGDVARSLKQHKNLDTDQQGLLLFGYGDGGGGPTGEMLEKLRRARGISDTSGMLPRVHLGSSIDQFFDHILESTDNGKELVTWEGELYLEYHRGTYTTQAAIKYGNRKSEVLMHDVEFAATIASIKSPTYKYPTSEIDAIWQDICLNQFHDVLPGSGIEMIYEDARLIYQKVEERGKKLLKGALDALGFDDHFTRTHSQLAFLNTLPWGRCEVVEIPKTEKQSLADRAADIEISGKPELALVSCSGSGVAKAIREGDAEIQNIPKATVKEVEKGVFVLENDRLRVVVEGGSLTSVWDYEAQREVLPKGTKGNQLVILKDTPLAFPAWDTELFSLENKSELPSGEVAIVQNGPLRAAVAVTQKISEQSNIRTTISLDAYVKPKDSSTPDVSMVQFACEVNWHEKYKFLKVEFPVDVRSALGSYETSYGYHQRPTHYNTSWDVAKFEVCGHKWADLSDYSYGSSILNNCKYGYNIHGNVMTLSLLRSPKNPDAHADMGYHEFRYAFLPHKGGLSPDVVRAGYNFNYPLNSVYLNPPAAVPVSQEDGTEIGNAVQAADASIEVFKSIQVLGDKSLVFSCLKRFEDDEDVSRGDLPVRGGKGTKSVIVRVYDSLGGTSRGYITSKYAVSKAYKTNILEDDGEPVDILSDQTGEKIPIELKPFEVATYRLELA